MTSASSSATASDPGQPILLLGVDAGGSKTVASLARYNRDSGLALVGSGRAGSGNPLAVGVDRAFESLSTAIQEACASLSADQRPKVAVIAAAGSAAPEVREELAARSLAAGFADDCRIESDATPLLATAAIDGPCVGLISGTGSVAIARSPDGNVVSQGGWGYLLGDEGSGYSIGRAAIRATLRCEAGPDLTREVCRRLNAGSVEELVRVVYASQQPQRAVASAAEAALDAAASGNATAVAIAHQAAESLKELLRDIESAAGLSGSTYPLVLSGAVLTATPVVREELLRLAGRSAEDVVVSRDTTAGCLRLAVAYYEALA